MQTFLPYADFAQSAACIDRQRLGKQRIEVLQLLKALLVPGAGWRNHPAAKMWRGYEWALFCYGAAICREWIKRGYKDTCLGKLEAMSLTIHPGGFWVMTDPKMLPPWFGDPAFHLAHKSNLVRKLPEHYGKLWPDVPADLPYVWPV